MWILQRYISREFINYFLACLLSLIFIAIIFSVLAELGNIDKENGWEIFKYNVLSGIPLLIEVITPISVLLATVLTFISLSRSSETIAMMAAGVSLFQMVLPVLMVGMIITTLTYLNQSYMARWLGADKRVGLVQTIQKEQIWRYYKGDLFFFSSPSKASRKVDRAKIFQFNPRHQIKHIDSLTGLQLKKDSWQVKEVRGIEFQKEQVFQDKQDGRQYADVEFPVVFKKELSNPKYHAIGDLIEDIQIKKQGAVNVELDVFALYQKIAGLFAIFVMILMALPFSLYSGRSANVRTGIVLSIILGFTFWLMDQIFVSLQSTGILPIAVSAFGAHISFTTLALFLIVLKRV